MGKVKTVQDYQDTITLMHKKLYSPGAKNDVERTMLERQLKRQLGAWANKVMVVIETPGNEQNPWTYEELGRPVRPMGLKGETGKRQTGDYLINVCVCEDGYNGLPAKWVYLPVVVERKGGKGTKRKVDGEYVYGTGRGGPHDLYGSLYGKTELKGGSIRYNRDRLHEEIDRFKEDDRFKDGQFWIIAECTEADFLQYKPVFNGSKRNKGYGANVESRRESIWSLAVHMGAPIHWAGTRHAAIKDFNSIIRQGLIRHYAYLLGL